MAATTSTSTTEPLRSPALTDEVAVALESLNAQRLSDDGSIELWPALDVPVARRPLSVLVFQSTGSDALPARRLAKGVAEAVANGCPPDIVVCPENWMGGPPSIEGNKLLLKYSTIAAEYSFYAVFGSSLEVDTTSDEPGRFNTATLIGPDGSLLGTYRKQRPVGLNLDRGSGPGVWDTAVGRLAILICFDIENADVYNATIAEKPGVILNPVFIPIPRLTGDEAARVSTWNISMETMARKFEALATEADTTIVRCDAANPYGFGTSITVGPYTTVYAPTRQKANFTVHIDPLSSTAIGGGSGSGGDGSGESEVGCSVQVRSRNSFQAVCKPPTVFRTAPEDNTGNRYTLRTYGGHKGPVTCAAMSTVNRVGLLTGSTDSTLRLWHTFKHTLTASLVGHTGPVTGVVYNGKEAVSCSLDGTLRLWDVNANGGVSVGASEPGAGGMCLDWAGSSGSSGSEGVVVVGATDGSVSVIDTREGFAPTVQLRDGDAGSPPVRSVVSLDSCGGAGLFAVAVGSSVELWDVAQAGAGSSPVAVYEVAGGSSTVSALAAVGDGLIAAAAWDGSTCVLDFGSAGGGEGGGLAAVCTADPPTHDSLGLGEGGDATAATWVGATSLGSGYAAFASPVRSHVQIVHTDSLDPVHTIYLDSPPVSVYCDGLGRLVAGCIDGGVRVIRGEHNRKPTPLSEMLL